MATALVVLAVGAAAVGGDVWAWRYDGPSRGRLGVLLMFTGIALSCAVIGVLRLLSSFVTRTCRHCGRPVREDGQLVAFPPTALAVLITAHERHDVRALHELAASPRRVVACNGPIAGLEVVSCPSCAAVGEMRVVELPKGFGAYVTGRTPWLALGSDDLAAFAPHLTSVR
jgi:hypothetical protein